MLFDEIYEIMANMTNIVIEIQPIHNKINLIVSSADILYLKNKIID